MLNVALGGTLIVDIATQVPKALNHRRMDKKMEPVHDVTIATDSMLRQITGEQTLGVNSTHHQAIGTTGANRCALWPQARTESSRRWN